MPRLHSGHTPPTLSIRASHRRWAYCCQAAKARRWLPMTCSSTRSCTVASRGSTVSAICARQAKKKERSRRVRCSLTAARIKECPAGRSTCRQAAAAPCQASKHRRSSAPSRCNPAAASRPRRSTQSRQKPRHACQALSASRRWRWHSRSASILLRCVASRHLASHCTSRLYRFKASACSCSSDRRADKAAAVRQRSSVRRSRARASRWSLHVEGGQCNDGGQLSGRENPQHTEVACQERASALSCTRSSKRQERGPTLSCKLTRQPADGHVAGKQQR